MYVLIVSDAPTLPVDLCIASAMLGHAAWAFRPEEFDSGNGARPALVILDLDYTSDIPGAIAKVRRRHPDMPIAVLTNNQFVELGDDESFFLMSRPVSPSALRDLMSRATPVAA